MSINLHQQLEEKSKNLNSLLQSRPSFHYKVYKIPKRTMGFRIIAQPTPQLKQVQRKLVSILEDKVAIHSAAMAYRKDLSIKDNAQKHAKSEYLLKTDIKNFFNSLTPIMFFKAIRGQGVALSTDEKELVKQLFFWNPSKRAKGKLILSVGAPSSPFVSNVIMYQFDNKIEKLCAQQGVVYTRYADDLTFSTCKKGVLFELIKELKRLLQQEFGNKLLLNDAKTVFASKAHNRHVTGITLTNNNKISIGRERRRYISALIHKFKLGQLADSDIYHLQGLLAFAGYIEPNFIIKMKGKYSSKTIEAIKRYSPGEEYE